MKYAIVYSSRTGNTRLLAETLRDSLPGEDCLYFGPPEEAALAAERIYVGFWTDKGTCDAVSAAFLQKTEGQEIFLFGTAGFGESREYFNRVLKRTAENLGKGVTLAGTFMCQGRMPAAVRERYEKMSRSPVPEPRLRSMIENFDRALTHPDAADLEALRRAAAGVRWVRESQ